MFKKNKQPQPQPQPQSQSHPTGLATGLTTLFSPPNPSANHPPNYQQNPNFFDQFDQALQNSIYTKRPQVPCPNCNKHNQPHVQYCMTDHEPMCQVCIGQHIELHQKGLKTDMKFVSIDEALDAVREKFRSLRESILEQMKQLDSEDINAHLEDMVQRVIVAKKYMVGEVNKIAESRLKDIEIIESNYRKVQFKKPFREAGEVINGFILGLQAENRIEKIQHAALFNETEFKSIFDRTIKENRIELEKSKCNIIYDKVQFSKMLQKCFYLSIPAYGQATQDDMGHQQKTKKAMGNKIFQSFQNNLLKQAEQQKDNKMQKLRELIQKDENNNKGLSLSVEQQKRIEYQNEMKKKRQSEKVPIENGSSFAQRKMNIATVKQKLPIVPAIKLNYIHYFQTGSRKIHIYDIGSGTYTPRTLKSDPIPFYHKSIQTSDSTVFLSGGKLSTSKTAKRNQSLWIYNIKKDTFRIGARNLKPRSSHSLVEHKGFLYIIGGFNETNFQREMERFDLPEAKSLTYCNPSNYAGECVSASVGDHIWKISMDGIQIYSAQQDKWAYVTIKEFVYYESCMCAAINNDQLFVFGGYDETERGVKNTHVIRKVKPIEKVKDIDGETFEIEKKNKYLLIDAEGFSDNTVAMDKGNNIYCWINDSNQYNEVRTDRKTMIMFDSAEWKYVPPPDKNGFEE